MLRRRCLGRTGLLVSELSLGTVELGLDYGIVTPDEPLKPDERQAAAVLNEALDLGLNLIDTARAYGDAEAIIGRTLHGRRNEFVLVSKVVPAPGQPEHVRRSVEESLRVLQTDHIDVLLLHCRGEALPDPDTAGALLACRDAGQIQFAGASVYGEAAALDAIRSGWCDCIEVAYNPIDRRPEGSVLSEAATHNIGVLARSVLLKGALTRRYRLFSGELDTLRSTIDHLLQTTQIGIERLPELAYRYVLTREPPHSALVGTARLAELRACVGYAQQGPLAPDLVAQIRGVALPPEKWLNPFNWPRDISR